MNLRTTRYPARTALAALLTTTLLLSGSLALHPAPAVAQGAGDPLLLPDSARPEHRDMLRRLLSGETTPGFVPSQSPGMNICWQEGSDPDLAATFDQALERKGIALFRLDDTDRWSTTATDGSGLGQGDPTTLTWGFVPDGTAIGGYAGEAAAPSDLIAFLDGIYGSGPGGSDLTLRPWFGLFELVFANWSGKIGVNYVYEPNDDGVALAVGGPGNLGTRADVRIGGHLIDGNSGILAYNFFPNTSDMVIDTGDSFFSNTGTNSLRLRNVVAHEHGHGLGFSHVCPVNQSKLMEPFVSVNFDGVQFDDELGGNRGYGDVGEFPVENDSYTLASDLGTFNSTGTVFIPRSIDDNSDEDFLAFTVPAGASATVNLIPRGFVYLEGPQNPDGSCTPGTQISTNNVVDLGVELLDTDGSSLIAGADNGGAGSIETIPSTSLPSGAGTYYIRVYGANVNAAQLYQVRLDVTVAPQNTAPTALCQDVFSCDGNVVAADVDNGSSDAEDPITLSLEPAGPYPPGLTVVDLIVSDGSLADTCSATITVNEAPVAAARNFFATASGAGCTVAVPADSLDDGSSDPNGGPLVFSVEPAGPYGAGVTALSFIVVDSCGAADTAFVDVTVNCLLGPNLEVDPATLVFSATAVGDTACLPVTVRNTGDTPLTIDSVTGCDTGNFHLDLAGLASPVAPGDSTSFVVCLIPTVSGSDSCTVSVATPDSTAAVLASVTSTLAVPGEGGIGSGRILAAVVPNPFRASTEIRFELPQEGRVSVEVFDLQGRLLRTLLGDAVLPAGVHGANWDGRTDAGARAASGMYFIRLRSATASSVIRAVLMP